MIVSLGFLQTPREMAMLMIGVAVLTAAGWAINRALGVPMPSWSAKEWPPVDDRHARTPACRLREDLGARDNVCTGSERNRAA